MKTFFPLLRLIRRRRPAAGWRGDAGTERTEMHMRKKMLLMLLAGVLCLSLAGCGQGGALPEEEDSPQTREPTEEADSPTEETDGSADGEDSPEEEAPQYTDNFSVDAAAVADFAEQIQAAMANRDLEALADLAAYPLYVGFAEGGESVESREDFLALGAERIFSEEMLSEIAGADTEGLEASMAGFSLTTNGRPNVIFGASGGRLAIVGMNY